MAKKLLILPSNRYHIYFCLKDMLWNSAVFNIVIDDTNSARASSDGWFFLYSAIEIHLFYSAYCLVPIIICFLSAVSQTKGSLMMCYWY
jgi:hypothetical protein